MAYEFKNSKGVSYFLHSKNVTLKGGRLQTIYYFGRVAKEGAIDAIPDGFVAIETAKTGMPILKKK
jgi:hypothetical protein